MTTTLDSTLPPSEPAAGFGHRLAPPGDPLEGAAFEAIYDAKIKPELVKCEAERRAALQTFVVTVAAGAIVIFLEYMLTPVFFHGVAAPPIQLPIFTGIGALVLAYLPLGRVAREAKLSVIRALCEPLGVTYALTGADGPAFETFLQLKLLPHPSEKAFQDFFSGRRGPIDFALCEATLTQGSGKERHTVFQGQLLRLTTAKPRLSTTVVARNSGWMNRFECPSGMQPVGLEDPRFNKEFAVFGSDQVEAREILTPSFMQQLVDLESVYSGAHLRCAFCGPDLLVAVEGPNRFEIGSMFTTLVEVSRVEGIARNIEQVFKLIDEFASA
jgi:hypothetical protein